MAHDELIARVKQYQAKGIDASHAFGLAAFESRIEAWPAAWGNDFVAVLFGDFTPPDEDLEFSELDIIVESKPLENTIVRSARTTLRAKVRVHDKSVAAVKDATKRLNLLVGLLSCTNNGAPIRWWSFATHGTNSSVGYKLQTADPLQLLALVDLLPIQVRNRVTAAMYWIREPRGMLLEHSRGDQLAVFAGYWNAFECLVDAANTIMPRKKLGRGEKKAQIRCKLAQVGDDVGPGDIESLYRQVVNPQLRPKAEHAIKLCTGNESAKFIHECFDYKPEHQQLYRLRNAIDHGTVDVDDPETTILLESRFTELWVLVFSMLRGVLTLNVKSLEI